MKNILLWIAFGFISLSARAEVVALPAVPGDLPSPHYEVFVNDVPVPTGTQTFPTKKGDAPETFDYAAFTMEGTVTVRIVASGSATKPSIRPLHLGIIPKVEGNSFNFTISQPHKLMIETDGNHRLILLATPPEEAPPKPDDKDVIYFGPGVHRAGVISPQSGQTVYLAPGALVHGRIHCFEVNDVKILGRGMLDATGYSGSKDRNNSILFERCQRVRLEGIGARARDPFSFWQVAFINTVDAGVAHINLMAFTAQNDGVDIENGVRNLLVRDSFLGCGDDCLGWHACQAVQFGADEAVNNVRSENNLMLNRGHGNGMRIGSSMEVDEFYNVHHKGNSVLQSKEYAIRSDFSDWATARNLVFEGIRSEDGGIDFVIAKTVYSNDNGYRDKLGQIDGLVFKDIRLPADATIRLHGAGPDSMIRNVYFKDVYVGDELIVRPEQLDLNPWVSGVHFGVEPVLSAVRPAAPPATDSPDERLIDDSGPGFSHHGFTREECRLGSLGEIRHSRKAMERAAYACYRPAVSGNYEVLIHQGKGSGLSAHAPWTVRHVGGWTTRPIDQNREAGWVSHGIYQFDGASYVKLVEPNNIRTRKDTVVADAVMFRKVKP